MKKLPLCVILLFGCLINAKSQDSTLRKLPDKYLSTIQRKSHQFEERISRYNEKVLSRLERQEARMQRRLKKIDPEAAKRIFTTGNINNANAGSPMVSGYLDTLQNTLRFLGKYNGQLDALKGKLQQTEQIKTYIRERKEQLKNQLSQYTGFTRSLQRYNKEAYYYGARIREYKAIFEDPKKVERKAIGLLTKIPAYNSFLQRNSRLAGLFGLSANFNATRSLEGLQTRTQVEQLISQRVGSTPEARQAVSQQMDEARSRFDELKSKFPQLDNAAEMPGFKPNEMKTKRFIQRLEFGGNVQFQRSNRYYPTTTDIAGQVGYKFHKNGIAGVGLAYRLGMGTGWEDISFSHRGAGLRGFAEWKLKGNFWANGGYEMNKGSTFRNLAELKNWNGWQRSALIGISKKYKINAKLKGNIMILYDVLAPQQLPQSDKFKIRIGYIK